MENAINVAIKSLINPAGEAKPGSPDLEYSQNPETHEWNILRKLKDGTATPKDTGIPAIPLMEEREALLFALEYASKEGTKREAMLTLIARIMMHGEASIAAWRGKGKPEEQLDRTLKGEFQRCEDAYFQQYMDPKHKDHKLFIGRLPKLDARNKPLEIGGKLEPRKQFDAFLTGLRKETNYSTWKSVCLHLFSITGAMPVDKDGNLIPPEVLNVMRNKARMIEPQDTGFRTKLGVLYRVLTAGSDEGESPKENDLPLIVAMLEEMHSKAKELADIAAAKATMIHQTTGKAGVVAQADAAIESAKRTLDAIKTGATEVKDTKKAKLPEVH